MAVAAYIVELIFGAAGLVPQLRSAEIVEAHFTWNYTTWLNIAFLSLAALLVRGEDDAGEGKDPK